MKRGDGQLPISGQSVWSCNEDGQQHDRQNDLLQAKGGFQGKSCQVHATFKAAEVVRYAKQDEVFLDLVNGRIDATLADSVAADQGFLKTPSGKGFAFRGAEFNDPAFFGTGAGIAVRKGDKALQAKLNAALAAIRADGTYKRINDTYFDFDVYGAELKK